MITQDSKSNLPLSTKCFNKDFNFREQASIFSRLGFDGLFFGRLDWRDKDTRIQNQTMEVIWKAGHYEEDNLFTGVLYNYYSPPPYFCWDLLCNDEPIMDNPSLHDYNIDRRARDFIEYARQGYKVTRFEMNVFDNVKYVEANHS